MDAKDGVRKRLKNAFGLGGDSIVEGCDLGLVGADAGDSGSGVAAHDDR
jgi:hypothetical protein